MDGQGKYGAIVVYDGAGERKEYPEGMPLFVLLGKDALAPAAVDAYAAALEAAAALPENAEAQESLRAQAGDVRAFALRMRTWQIENPAAVKRPD